MSRDMERFVAAWYHNGSEEMLCEGIQALLRAIEARTRAQMERAR